MTFVKAWIVETLGLLKIGQDVFVAPTIVPELALPGIVVRVWPTGVLHRIDRATVGRSEEEGKSTQQAWVAVPY
jgi:hypothetical protein